MNKKTAWLIVVIIIVLAFALYRYRALQTRLNVEPHAAEEIEKAKRR